MKQEQSWNREQIVARAVETLESAVVALPEKDTCRPARSAVSVSDTATRSWQPASSYAGSIQRGRPAVTMPERVHPKTAAPVAQPKVVKPGRTGTTPLQTNGVFRILGRFKKRKQSQRTAVRGRSAIRVSAA